MLTKEEVETLEWSDRFSRNGECVGIYRDMDAMSVLAAGLRRREEQVEKAREALDYLSGEIGKIAHGEAPDCMDLLVCIERAKALTAPEPAK